MMSGLVVMILAAGAFLLALDATYAWRRRRYAAVPARPCRGNRRACRSGSRFRFALAAGENEPPPPAEKAPEPAPGPEPAPPPNGAPQDAAGSPAGQPASPAPATLPTVHIQVAAFTIDIPVGTTVNIALSAVDDQGHTSVRTTTLKGGQAAPGGQPFGLAGLKITPAPAPARERRTSLAARAGQSFSAARQALLARAWHFDWRRLDQLLLAAAVAVYALAVGTGIDRYPIYFFTDEAAHMNLAFDFLHSGLKNYFGEFLPTFFSTAGWVNGTSVYVQVLPLLLFGKSVAVTRLVSAFISLLGALAVSLLLRDVFKLKYYWAGILLVLTTPAWFLHARTAFEYVEVGAFYSLFLYFYGRYRAGYLRSLYWALLAGALAFYTHGLGQILMTVTGLALFIVDFRYHFHRDRRRTVLWGLALGVVLLLPFVRYYWAHPGEAAAQMQRRGSYWSNTGLPLAEKIWQFLGQYTYGLSPLYWYLPNKVDISRHIMYQYGDGLWYTLPLVVVGLLRSLKNIRQPAYRLVLIALLACPVPAAIVAIGMPRMIFITVPLAILGMLGLTAILDWAAALKWGRRPWRLPARWLAAGVFVLLAGLSFFMLGDALINGPTWFPNYGLYGMQYGAKQVFQDVVRAGLQQDPNRRYVVSPSWANGVEQLEDFFIPQALQPRLRLGQPVDVIEMLKAKPADLYFVSTADEYTKLTNNPEFKDIQVRQTLLYPDGQPGFYVLTLSVADNVDEIIAAQQALAVTPVEDVLVLQDQRVRIIHSPLGSGSLEDIFDADPETLARVMQANPCLFDLYYPAPTATHSVVIQTGSLPDFTVKVSLYAPGAAAPTVYTQTFQGLPPDPLVTLNFDRGPAASVRMTVEIKDNTAGKSAQIHVRTIQFK